MISLIVFHENKAIFHMKIKQFFVTFMYVFKIKFITFICSYFINFSIFAFFTPTYAFIFTLFTFVTIFAISLENII